MRLRYLLQIGSNKNYIISLVIDVKIKISLVLFLTQPSRIKMVTYLTFLQTHSVWASHACARLLVLTHAHSYGTHARARTLVVYSQMLH